MVCVNMSNSGPIIGETRLLSKANLRPLLFCALTSFASILYGFDGTLFTSILQMDKFNRDYGQPAIVDGISTYIFPSNQKAVVTSIIQAGEFCGALLAGPVGDRAGRRGAFFGAIFFLTIGTILQLIVAGSVPLLGVGRALLGIGVGFLANTTPLYLSEISTPSIRGAVVGSWQLMLAIGQVIYLYEQMIAIVLAQKNREKARELERVRGRRVFQRFVRDLSRSCLTPFGVFFAIIPGAAL